MKHNDQKDEGIEIEVQPRNKKNKEDPQKNKFAETIDNLKEHETTKAFLDYAQKNTQDTVAFVLLAIGILWSFFHFFYGGILIGLVAGFYFSKEIIRFLKNYNQWITTQGTTRSIVFAGAALALFIASPGIFLGALAMVGLKILLRAE